MDNLTIISWVNALASIIGNILIIKKKRSGFLVWVFSNIIWIIVDCSVGLYSQAALFVVFTIIVIYGFIKWKEDDGIAEDRKGHT